MTYRTYPTIAMFRAAGILADYEDRSIDELRELAGDGHPHVEPAMRGHAASDEDMSKLASEIRELAIESGYPSPIGRTDVRKFDRPAGGVLHDVMSVSPADAARPEVWNFVSLILLPDVAVWRFPSRQSYRILGAGYGEDSGRGGRNAFGRLWWAVDVLGDEARMLEPDEYGQPLGEDEVVGIMERSSAIAPSPVVARALARTGRQFYSENMTELEDAGIGGRMSFFRRLFKEIPRLRAFINVNALDSDQVQELVDSACGRVLAEAPMR